MVRSASRCLLILVIGILSACGGGNNGTTIPAAGGSLVTRLHAHGAHVRISEYPLPWASSAPFGAKTIAQAADGSVYLAVLPNTAVPSGAARFASGRFSALAQPPVPSGGLSNLGFGGPLAASVTGPVYGEDQTDYNGDPDLNFIDLVGYRGTAVTGIQQVSSGANYVQLTTDSSGDVWWDDCGGQVSGETTFPSSPQQSKSTTITFDGAAANLQEMTYGPANALWIWSLGLIYEVSTKPALLNTFTFPYGGFAATIAGGAEGNVWMTVTDGTIVRMSTSGAFTQFSLPNGGFAADISNGPDGDMWFVDSANNAVGSISTSGQINEYAVPTANAGLTSISGPVAQKKPLQRAVWFVENKANKIGKLEVR